MKSLSKIIITSILGLVISVSLFVFLIKPTTRGLVESNATAVQKKTDLKTLEEQIIAYRNSQKDLARASERAKIIDSIVIKENLEIPVKEIEAAAVKTGVDEALKISEDSTNTKMTRVAIVKNSKKIEEVPYTILSTSDFTNVINFLQLIENLPHFSEVSKISLSAVTSTQSNLVTTHTGNILGTIDGVFFIKKP
jgi:hypothetical protein